MDNNRTGQTEDRFDLIAWRRAQIWEYLASGKTHQQIADILKLARPTISKEVGLMRKEVREKHAELLENLPFRHALRTAGMDKAIKELWSLFERESDTRGRKGILDSLTDAYIKQAAIDGDPTAISSALRKISQVRKRLAVESTQSNTESYDSGNSDGAQQEELQEQQEEQEVSTSASE